MSTREEKVEAFTKQLMSEGWSYALAYSRARAAYFDGTAYLSLPDEPAEAVVDACVASLPPLSKEYREQMVMEQATSTVDRVGDDPEELSAARRSARRKTKMCLECGAVILRTSDLCRSCDNRNRHERGVYDDCERNTVFANPRRGA